MSSVSNIASRANADLLESKYVQWREDPQSVEPTWSAFFEGFELGLAQPPKPAKGAPGGAAGASPEPDATGGLDLASRARIVSLVHTYRSLGHTAAWLDPLSDEAPEQSKLSLAEFGLDESQLDIEVSTQFFESGRRMPLRELIGRLRAIYCQRIGFEYMHIHHSGVRHWLRERIEARLDAPAPSRDRKLAALAWLEEAEEFERFLHRRFVGQKRFSLEGGESLMIALQAIFERCPEQSVTDLFMGMAHRGRLNVLANFLHKPLRVLFYEFSENYVPDLVAGDGDVKYHLGFEAVRETRDGKPVFIELAANPSHLEAVNGVVEGKVRARQRHLDGEKRDRNVERRGVLPVLIHGDAAFAGQGSVAELLNLSQLPGYRTGGTIHIVVNNQIGFTTSPEDARSSAYCTDVAKMIEAPVIHVNGDSPLDVMFAAELALDFRQQWQRDVVIDIVCYRRHGHNEGDEPVFTQPKMYREVRAHESTANLFKKELVASGEFGQSEVDAIETQCQSSLDAELQELEVAQAKGDQDALRAGRVEPQPPYSHEPVLTGIPVDSLRSLGLRLAKPPKHMEVNEKLAKRFLESRRKAAENGGPYNWAFAEALAFGSLIEEGRHVRLSGQDCRRGTFAQRHAVIYDAITRKRYTPLNHLSPDQPARLWVYNSLLSEFAVLAFEYGYSVQDPDSLVLWEAQFGDFANGAQVIIDQFISSAESKWQRPSHLTLLLPHGYEGQGPEHSSARLERFLQLCAEQNMRVCNLTKPAQYFHALRRQMHSPIRKPLVLMTPKSLLNHEGCVSHDADFAEGTAFREILDDDRLTADDPERIERLVFCTGKVYYDLIDYRTKHEIRNTAIIRIEQLYPLNEEMLREITGRYPNSHAKWVWCQEEPLNMGAWTFIGPRLERLTHHRVRYAGRDRASSPAAGAKAIHVRQQASLIEAAFSV
ncbi:MAG: 2-oxoglutarate dehydrogenase E1 component [Verrucomicrobiales bacterium]|nr:2-oxoglutarate dehydrogenase E1 component [Verrucomicrobiales bacterium]